VKLGKEFTNLADHPELDALFPRDRNGRRHPLSWQAVGGQYDHVAALVCQSCRCLVETSGLVEHATNVHGIRIAAQG
jgi:hypothetical protein